MNNVMIENWNSTVSKCDRVILAGDVFLKLTQKEALAIRRRLNGNIDLVLGNHDEIAKSIPQAWGWIKESYQYSNSDPKVKLDIRHCAGRTWPGIHRGVAQLYGHSHGALPDDPNLLSFDIGVDCWNFTPVSLPQIMEKIEHKKHVRELHRKYLDKMLLLKQTAEAMMRSRKFPRGPGEDPEDTDPLDDRKTENMMMLRPETLLALITHALGALPEERSR